jgi:aspartate kinase
MTLAGLEIMSTSEVGMSVVGRDTEVDGAVRALHEAFELGR